MGGRYGYFMDCQYKHLPVGDPDYYGVLPYNAIVRADQVVEKRIRIQIADCGFRIAELRRR
jgi:hypothetical protein